MVAAITLLPTSGTVGTTGVTVSGTGYTSGQTISTFTFGGVTPATNTVIGQVVSGGGTFSGTFTIPAHSKGAVTVVAADALPETASATFTVTNGLIVSPTSGTEGTTVTATGSGYTATDALTGITIGGVTPLTQTVTSQTVATNGSWSGTFVVPALTTGSKTVTATTAADTASATFTMSSQTVGPDASGPVHGTSHATTTVTATLSTTSSPDLIVATVAWEDTGYASVTVTDATPLVWNPRSEPFTFGQYKIQEFTAPAAAAITSKLVTATFSSAISGYAALSVIGITNIAGGFDANLGFPSAVKANGTLTSITSYVTTRDAPDLLFGAVLVAPQTTVTAGTGWTQIDAVNATDFELQTEYQEFATLQLNTPIAWSVSSASYTVVGNVDAILGTGGSTGPWTVNDIGATVTNVTTNSIEQAVGNWYMPTITTSGETVTYNRNIGGQNTLISIVGDTTSASSTTLTDTNLALTTNELVGAILTYATGPAAPQFRTIASNTSDTITTAAFSPAPTSGGGDSFNVTGGQTTLTETHTSAISPIIADNPTNYWPGSGSKSIVATG